MADFDVIARILELCDTRKWTYYRLAKESGIAYSTLNTMLHKTTTPSVPTIARLCDGFGITIAQFFSLEDDISKLTDEEKVYLSKWSELDSKSKDLALAYIQGLIDRQ